MHTRFIYSQSLCVNQGFSQMIAWEEISRLGLSKHQAKAFLWSSTWGSLWWNLLQRLRRRFRCPVSLTLLLSQGWFHSLLLPMGFLFVAGGKGGVVVDNSKLLLLQLKVKIENDLPKCQYIKPQGRTPRGSGVLCPSRAMTVGHRTHGVSPCLLESQAPAASAEHLDSHIAS